LLVYGIKQECRTWLNVATNQELSKSDYETVRQSYAAAMECARQTGDVKQQVHFIIVTETFYSV